MWHHYGTARSNFPSFSEHPENPVRWRRIHSRSEIETGEVEEQRRGEAQRVDPIHHPAVARDGCAPVLRAKVALDGGQLSLVVSGLTAGSGHLYGIHPWTTKHYLRLG